MNEVEGEVGQISPHAPVISRPRHLRGTRYRGYDISRVHHIAVRDITWYDIFSKSYDGVSDMIKYHAISCGFLRHHTHLPFEMRAVAGEPWVALGSTRGGLTPERKAGTVFGELGGTTSEPTTEGAQVA